MDGPVIQDRMELKKRWVFGKNSFTTRRWKVHIDHTAGEIRNVYELPKDIPDCAVLRQDFSFEWIEIMIQASPDTPEMEIIACAAK